MPAIERSSITRVHCKTFKEKYLHYIELKDNDPGYSRSYSRRRGRSHRVDPNYPAKIERAKENVAGYLNSKSPLSKEDVDLVVQHEYFLDQVLNSYPVDISVLAMIVDSKRDFSAKVIAIRKMEFSDERIISWLTNNSNRRLVYQAYCQRFQENNLSLLKTAIEIEIKDKEIGKCNEDVFKGNLNYLIDDLKITEEIFDLLDSLKVVCFVSHKIPVSRLDKGLQVILLSNYNNYFFNNNRENFQNHHWEMILKNVTNKNIAELLFYEWEHIPKEFHNRIIETCELKDLSNARTYHFEDDDDYIKLFDRLIKGNDEYRTKIPYLIRYWYNVPQNVVQQLIDYDLCESKLLIKTELDEAHIKKIIEGPNYLYLLENSKVVLTLSQVQEILKKAKDAEDKGKEEKIVAFIKSIFGNGQSSGAPKLEHLKCLKESILKGFYLKEYLIGGCYLTAEELDFFVQKGKYAFWLVSNYNLTREQKLLLVREGFTRETGVEDYELKQIRKMNKEQEERVLSKFF